MGEPTSQSVVYWFRVKTPDGLEITSNPVTLNFPVPAAPSPAEPAAANEAPAPAPTAPAGGAG